jgi:exopolyphosphatase/guanosine-5'-triphosphate,3'-diphosphate pyrophosphatase
LPGKKHDDFSAMPAGSQRIVKVLGALLRIADALDRSQFSVVQTVRVTLGKHVTILLEVAGDAELEVWAARGRADLFEKVFHRSVQFEVIAPEEGAA